MKLFKCQNCDHPVYFDNTYCGHCHCKLGFDPVSMEMLSLKPEIEDNWVNIKSGKAFRYCKNHSHDVCNWLIAAEDKNEFCRACQHNRVIPNLAEKEFLERWNKVEQAKRRLIYSLIKWKLPLISKLESEDGGLVFDFKSDEYGPEGKQVLTGHAMGVITINIAEADDVEREMAKKQMDEVYRTLLGHFRHEVGHYYWERLIAQSQWLEGFRNIFGNEELNYGKAMDNYYQNGPKPNWQIEYISAYATMHPWEDWAETWAHYMHIVDTLETAFYFGIGVDPRQQQTGDWLKSKVDENAYDCSDFQRILDMWMPLSIALNSVSRSMGAQDPYPFVINSKVIEKLSFIHKVIKSV